MFNERHFNEINNITDVSRETFSDIIKFSEKIIKWNNAVNLVSKKSLSVDELWSRHILDSVQLVKYIPNDAKVVTDFGSGGGFPAVILAIVGDAERHTHLIESDQRKCAFLIDVAREINKRITIHNDRIENISPWENDVLTCRAVASLDKLLLLTKTFHGKNKMCLFLKGAGIKNELLEVSKSWDLEYDIYPSITNGDGNIIKITKHNSRV